MRVNHLPNPARFQTFDFVSDACFLTIHPSSSSLSRDAQTSLSPDTSSSSSRRFPRHLPGQPSESEHVLLCPLGLLPWHLIQRPEPPLLAPLHVEEQRLYSRLLLGDRASHPQGATATLERRLRLDQIGQWPTNSMTDRLQQPLHRSARQSHIPSFLHSWTRPQDTTPHFEAGAADPQVWHHPENMDPPPTGRFRRGQRWFGLVWFDLGVSHGREPSGPIPGQRLC